MRRISKETIIILEKTVADRQKVRPGDIVQVDPKTAHSLIAMKKARKYTVQKSVELPLISVIIPFYNDYSFINDCLKSITDQTYKNIEIIIVNDGSEDEPEIFYPCRYISYKTNKGAPVARNIGANTSKGDYLFFCDADVTLHKDCLNTLYSNINGYSWAYCNFYIGDELHEYERFSFDVLKKRNLCSTMSLIKKADFPNFDHELIRFQDWDLFLNMAHQGKIGVHVPQVLFTAIDRVGITQGTISNTDAKNKIASKWGL